jgi:hypothetical protein
MLSSTNAPFSSSNQSVGDKPKDGAFLAVHAPYRVQRRAILRAPPPQAEGRQRTAAPAAQSRQSRKSPFGTRFGDRYAARKAHLKCEIACLEPSRATPLRCV